MPSAKKRSTKSSGKNNTNTQSALPLSWIIIGGILILVIAVGVVLTRSAPVQTPTAAADGSISGVQAYTGLSQEHVTTTVNYPQTPPIGGPHNPVPQTCGVYTDQIANEHAVHSLEHGAVWITYRPDLPADQLAYLQKLTRQTDHRLLSPYPGIDSPIIVTAWGFQLKLDNANDPRLMQFIQKYEQGATTPELGAACAGETATLKELGQ